MGVALRNYWMIPSQQKALSPFKGVAVSKQRALSPMDLMPFGWNFYLQCHQILMPFAGNFVEIFQETSGLNASEICCAVAIMR